jgi:hypothetical protein
MALLDDALAASGGVDRWQELTRFTAHISFDGSLIACRGDLRDMAAEGSVRTQCVRFSGFIESGQCAMHTPDCVTIERLDGSVVASRRRPGERFPGEGNHDAWDELDLAYFCGLSLWNCMTMPFVLLHPGVAVEELPVWLERGQVWRRLRAVFPKDVVTCAREQVLCFDNVGLLRQVEYRIAAGKSVVQHAWAHQTFSGITVPTLRRTLAYKADGTVIARPPLVDVEIFDARFE